MRGKAKVHWTEHRNKRTYTYTNEERYGNLMVTLWNGDHHDDKFLPGNHTFPFMFELPPGMPSTFETEHGKVIHEVKAVADRPWAIDEVERVFFNFHNIYDLNQDSTARYRIAIANADEAGSCCCVQGPIEFEMSADRTGYVPGEKIYISGKVINNTFSEVKYSEAKIVQKVNLVATNKSREEETTVQRVYRPSIRPGGQGLWSRVPLTVPAVSPSNLQYCRIIDIHYELVFVARLGTCKSASVRTPLIIGSVALSNDRHVNMHSTEPETRGVEFQHGYGPHPSAPPPPPVPASYMIDNPPPYPDMPPPSYEEAKISNNMDMEDDGGFLAKKYSSYGNV